MPAVYHHRLSPERFTSESPALPGLNCRSSIHFRISDRMKRTFDWILT